MHALPEKFIGGGMIILQVLLRDCTRIPFGHPEGFIEAFANVYNSAMVAVKDEISGKYPRKSGYDFPDIRDGIIGMAFIETVVKSSKAKDKWIKFPSIPK